MLAAYCCFLLLKTFAQVPQSGASSEPHSTGKKVLIKAIAGIVNSDSQKKAPAKKAYVPAAESPIG